MVRFKIFTAFVVLLSFSILNGCGSSGPTESSQGPGTENIIEQEEPEFVIKGLVKNFYTGEVVVGAEIRFASEENGASIVSSSVYSDEYGGFQLTGDEVLGRFVVSGYGAGYGEYSLVVENAELLAELDAGELLLQPTNISQLVDPDVGGDVVIDGLAVVTLPANGVVNDLGEAPVGQIKVNITIIDPSIDPSLMPGNYRTINSSGELSYIESYGAISVVLEDSEGNKLQLASGSNATIRIPVAAEAEIEESPSIIPLYYFDEATGYWVEEGSATLEQQDNGVYVYIGEVSHFTVWNADIIYQTVFLEGCVEDQFGLRLSDVTIQSSGRDYIGSSFVASDQNGDFKIPVKMTSEVLINAVYASVSGMRSISSGEVDTDISVEGCIVLNPASVSIELTWGAAPEDLDAHLWGPSDIEDGQFHLSYDEMLIVVNDAVVSLDVDDTENFGPEIITVPRFPLPGIYSYCVHHFSGSQTMLDSPVRVVLNIGDEQTIFSPQLASGDFNGEEDLWCVFSLEVDVDLVPTIVVDQFVTTEDPFLEEIEGIEEMQPASRSFNSMKHKKHKYFGRY